MHLRLLVGLFLFIFITLSSAVHSDAMDTRTRAALAAAEDFLALVDTARYAESWDEAATFFKAQVPRDEWVRQISSLRPAFGKVLERRLKSARRETSLPGAPDGLYIVIQYDTTFENKRKAVETITPMRENDGQWRVSGYYIK
ncbi:MAG: DUF4019 domain-containing protein [Desulfobulbaceae bacterium]